MTNLFKKIFFSFIPKKIRWLWLIWSFIGQNFLPLRTISRSEQFRNKTTKSFFTLSHPSFLCLFVFLVVRLSICLPFSFSPCLDLFLHHSFTIFVSFNFFSWLSLIVILILFLPFPDYSLSLSPYSSLSLSNTLNLLSPYLSLSLDISLLSLPHSHFSVHGFVNCTSHRISLSLSHSLPPSLSPF